MIFNKKKGETFRSALLLVFFFISVSILAFISENRDITGQVTATQNEISQPELTQFNDISGMETLAPGRYYIDGNGFVYLIDGQDIAKIAKIKFFDDSQKGKYIYVDFSGNVGYLVE